METSTGNPGKVDCSGCGKPVNARFAACPLCGAQLKEKASITLTSLDKGHKPNPAGVMADAGLPKEARIAMAQSVFSGRRPEEEQVSGASSGIIVALLPSKNTEGWMRTAEIVLTVISFPFFVVSMVGIVFQGVKRWGKIDAFTWITGAVFGGPALGLILYLTLDVSFTGLVWITGIGLAAWIGRAVIRWFAAAQRLSDYS